MLRQSISETPDALEGEIGIDSLISLAQSTSIIIHVILLLVTVGVTLWIAMALRAGRGYIRIVASALVLLQALSTVASPAAISVVSLAITAVAVTLSWTPPSTQYFAEKKSQRRQGRADRTDVVVEQ